MSVATCTIEEEVATTPLAVGRGCINPIALMATTSTSTKEAIESTTPPEEISIEEILIDERIRMTKAKVANQFDIGASGGRRIDIELFVNVTTCRANPSSVMVTYRHEAPSIAEGSIKEI